MKAKKKSWFDYICDCTIENRKEGKKKLPKIQQKNFIDMPRKAPTLSASEFL